MPFHFFRARAGVYRMALDIFFSLFFSRQCPLYSFLLRSDLKRGLRATKIRPKFDLKAIPYAAFYCLGFLFPFFCHSPSFGRHNHPTFHNECPFLFARARLLAHARSSCCAAFEGVSVHLNREIAALRTRCPFTLIMTLLCCEQDVRSPES